MLDSNGGMQSVGASRYTPWVCMPLCVLARAQELPQGNAGQLDCNGGMQSAHGVTLA